MAGATQEDLASLMVTISADLTRYRKDMASVVEITSKAAKASEKAAVSANDNIGRSFSKSAETATRSIRAVRGESANMAAQFQDIAVQLQGGGSPFTVALQQGQQLGAVLTSISQGGGSLFQGLAAAAGNFLNPITLITVAAIAAGGALFKMFSSGSSEDTIKELDKQISALKDLQKIAEATGNQPLSLRVGIEIDQAEVDKTFQILQQQIDANSEKIGGRIGKGLLSNLASSVGGLFQGTELGGLQAVIANLQDMPTASDEAQKKLDQLVQTFQGLDKAISDGDFQAAQDFLDVLQHLDLTGLSPNLVEDFANKLAQVAPGIQDIINKNKELKASQDDTAQAVAKILERTKDYDKAMSALEPTLTAQEKKIKDITDAWLAAVNIAQTYGQVVAANQAFTDKMAETSLDAARAIGTQSSSTSDYAKIVDRLEGTGKNPMSSAVGKFQFIDSTWIEQVRALGLGINKTDDQILKMRSDTELVDKVFEHFTEDNAARMRDVGVAVNDASKYMAHFLGVGDAIKVLKADPNSLISTILAPGKIAANRSLLGRPGETAGQFQDIINRKVNAAQEAIDPSDLNKALDALREQTDELVNGAKAAGQYSEAMDQVAHDKAFAEKQTALLNVAQKDGTAATAEETAQINAQAEAYAAAKGHTAAYTEEQKNAAVWQKALAGGLKDYAKAQEDLNAEHKKSAEAFAQLGVSFASTFINDLKEGKSAAEALRDALANLADQLLQMALKGLFTMLGNSLFGVTAAGGGVVGPFGVAGPAHQVSPYAFVGAPRMARGGFVGVGPGEYPTLLHRGELVVPAAMVRQAMGVGAQTSGSGSGTVRNSIGSISISVNNEQSLSTGDVKADTERGKQMGRIIMASVQSEIARQSRPGGMLTAQGSGNRVGR